MCGTEMGEAVRASSDRPVGYILLCRIGWWLRLLLPSFGVRRRGHPCPLETVDCSGCIQGSSPGACSPIETASVPDRSSDLRGESLLQG